MTEAGLDSHRREYSRSELSKKSVACDPFEQFGTWLNEALASDLPEPTAVTLSTASVDCRPSSRVVLLKGFDENGFVFFTNYQSRKGRDLESNPVAALNFFWPELERQVNVSGSVNKISGAESDEYFESRPFQSKIGAWASNQGEKIESRTAIMKRAAVIAAKHPLGHVPRPPHWGGFRLEPDRFEFWQGRPSRLHDRICYERDGDAWQIYRLSP
ncbi:MAG: pyridoxamine 5'-phosphate oxidase [Pyrinomonadaceae bacterium]